MIARIKGLKISQASERTAVTGQEMIPFQDGERNGKIRMIEFKDMTMYIFDPTIVDGKVSQEDYDALKQAIEEGKLIYTINSNRNGLDLATEVAIVGGTIYIESPDFIKEEGTDNISQVVFDTITVDGSLNYSKEQYTTTVIKTTGDGTKVLTDNGQYVYIGNLALTNIKFKDGTNVGYIGAGSTNDNDIYIQSQNDNSIHFCVSGYSTSAGMTVHTNSNVSIGGDAATEKLNVAGNIISTGKVSAANGFFKESDARLKSDIKPLDYTLEQICAIPTVSFIMNDQKQIGTIAQNLEELGFEDIVTESDTLKSEVKNPEQFESFTKDGEEYVKVKKVEYEMLGVLAIEGVKMLKDEIEKLKAEIETLKNKQHE